MPFEKVDAFCVVITATPREICITYPVGQQVCVSLPQIANADPSELLQQFFNQINALLAPLGPILNIIDAIFAIFECIKAIPKAITELDPTELINCLPGLAEAIQRLLKLLVQLSIPVLIVTLIDAILLYLQAQLNQILIIQSRLLSIIAAGTKAAEPGNFQLQLALDCINDNFAADIVNLNEQNKPLNRLIGIINQFAEILGIPGLPTVEDISDLDKAGDDIQIVIDALTALRDTIPVPQDP